VHHRDDPILLGSPPMKPPRFHFGLPFRAASIWSNLEMAGVTDVVGVWQHVAQLMTVVALKQRYAGHAKRAALIAVRSYAVALDLTTGSEATECAIKLSRSMGIQRGGTSKIGIVGFARGFHGRTLGAQQAGGMAGQKSWIVNEDPAILNAPFPDGYWQTDTSFETFLKIIAERGLKPEHIAGVMMETYQGVGPDFAPVEYVRRLAEWCQQNSVVLVFDEVQAGFGRTGKFWGFEHYGVTPDLICCGKGISSSLPISAVIGRAEIMDQFGPGSMTSTHTGNPVCCAAALASITKIIREDLTANAARLEPVLLDGLKKIQARHSEVIGHITARGLVGGMQAVKRGQKEPDHDLAHSIIERCFHKGLLFFAPVGAWGQTVKISPPLTIPEEALREGLAVLTEATDEAVAAQN